MGERYVALLRGINVGGKNKLPMKDLAAMFEAATCTDVRTYIQSGNVVFTAEPEVAQALPDVISGRIVEDFGYHVPVVLRSLPEMEEAVANNPFFAEGASPETLHIMFLADTPGAERVDALDPDRSPPDRFAVLGREVYLSLPNGAGNSKLTNQYFDRQLGTVSTARNWRTVTTLLAMMRGEG